MEQLLIAVGLNESAMRSDNPNVPITPREIATDVAECVEAGATVVHLHARDVATGATVFGDPQLYMEIWDEMERVHVDAPVYVTYEPTQGIGTGRKGYSHVEALAKRSNNRMEIAPVISGSFEMLTWHDPKTNGPVGISMARPSADILYELAVAREHDMWVSHDVFDPSGTRNAAELFRLGEYDRPMLLKFFMTEQFTFNLPPETRYLDALVSAIPSDLDAEWLVLPYGASWRTASALWIHAITHGGHIRVGLGDNPSMEGGYLPTNAARVAQMVQVAGELGRDVASVADVRQRFAPLKG